MNQIPLFTAIFQGIPESLAIVFLAMVLLKEKLNLKIILILGILHTVFAFLIRMLSFAFGVHTVLLIIVMSFMLMYVTKIEIIKIVPSVLFVVILLIFYEFITFIVLSNLFNLSYEMIFENNFLRVLTGLPQTILLFLTGLIILYKRRMGSYYNVKG